MASVIVTIKVMPIAPDVDLEYVQKLAEDILDNTVGQGDRKIEIEPVAFGLKAMNITFVMDESKGSPDPIADKLNGIEGVQSCEVTDVRRTIG